MDQQLISTGHVYLITNLVNGKKYVGYTTKTVADRWIEHKSASKGGSPLLFHKAIRKYSPEVFRVDCIETVRGSHAEIEAAEILHIAAQKSLVPSGYNLTKGGDGVDFSVPGVRERHIAAQRRKVVDPVWKQRNAEQLKRQHADPAWQRANADGIRKAQAANSAKAVARYAHLPTEEQAKLARRRAQNRQYKAAKYEAAKHTGS